MAKKITQSQLIGEIGEAAVRLRFLTMGFQFDGRSRLEAGVDGIAEVMDDGKPLGRMIAVQVKARESAPYVAEDSEGFSYLVRSEDLAYWRGTNLPIILVLYRRSDETFFWKEIGNNFEGDGRRFHFDKRRDILNKEAMDRLAALTVSKTGFGYYVPPLGGGEEALINILPISFPTDIFVASSPCTPKKAISILLDGDEPARFDWVIKGGIFWSFTDPRQSVCRHIVDLDQVEAINTAEIAFHDDLEEQNNFAYLLRKTLGHQVRDDLSWNKDRKLFYFKARAPNKPRTFMYEASKKRASTEVVNVAVSKMDATRIDFVRHHAFVPRFERLYDQWFLIVNPTYFFTTNGLIPHSYPAALLAGKKRLDNSASLRGQLVMWHRFLTSADREEGRLFSEASRAPRLRFGEPPTVALATRVPEDAWAGQKKAANTDAGQEQLFG
jgi:hypothetical protein